MTITYMNTPQNKLTLGATELVNTLIAAKVTRIENGWDTASIVLPDTSYYPSTVTEGTVVVLEVKDATDVSYTRLFTGVVRFVIANVGTNRTLTLSCRGIGSGLTEMLVATDYGSQSANGLDTITEMITDSTYGIIPNYVQKILGGSSSNYAYDTTYVETISDSIPYIGFPYKPADKALNDLCDLVTAYKAGTAGPHWIVTTNGSTNYLRVKLVNGTQTGWTKYYGDSQANATLTYGVDYQNINLEKMGAEKNYIVYYGAWRRPSNGDYWTNNSSSMWGLTSGSTKNSTTYNIVGTYGQQFYTTSSPSGPIHVYFPSSADAGWDFSSFTEFNTPNLNFYVYYDLTLTTDLIVRLYTDASNYYSMTLTPPNQQWHHYSLPVGPYFNTLKNTADTAKVWIPTNSPDWSDINYIKFYVADAELYNSGGDRYHFTIDGLHFGDAAVCRVAALSSYSGVILKQAIITDDVGKDDSLKATDDSGLIAKMAYSELLRLRTTSTVGTVETPMIKDILPGQWLYIQSADYRVTKITHNIVGEGYTSFIEVTDDVVNNRSRPRYEDINKQWASIRPEWQDRQAASLKSGKVDWRVQRLVKTYS